LAVLSIVVWHYSEYLDRFNVGTERRAERPSRRLRGGGRRCHGPS